MLVLVHVKTEEDLKKLLLWECIVAHVLQWNVKLQAYHLVKLVYVQQPLKIWIIL